MINWPELVINDIARRRAVIVIGAGVSKNSVNATGKRPKDWKELLDYGASNLKCQREVKSLMRTGDYLSACELIKKEKGRDDFNEFIKNEFITPRFQPAPIHEHLYNLDCRIILTPNFDKIYETYATTASHGSVTLKKHTDLDLADTIRGTESVVIKIHGSVESPDSLIFTRRDYAEARSKYLHTYRIINALTLTHTFVFIGCGVNDPDIRLILENYSFQFPYNRNHFIVMSRSALSKNMVEVVSETMSLKALLYDPSNHHEILTHSLSQLVKLVEIKRTEIASQMSW